MNLENVKLCKAGTETLHALIQHVTECEECQAQLVLTVKSFPFAALLLGGNPIESLKRMKGNDNGGNQKS